MSRYHVRKCLDDAGHDDLSEDDYLEVPYTGGPTILAESNRATILADMPAKEEIPCTVCDGLGVIGPADDRDHCKECDGYGNVEASWIPCIDCGNDGLLVHKDSKQGKEWIDSLDGYPVADESDFSEREWEAEREAWEDYGRADMRDELTRYLEARLAWLELEWPGEHNADDIIEALTDSQVDQIYHSQVEAHLGGERCTWEEDYDGSHAAFHVDRAVWGRNPYESRRADPPRWNDDAWDGLVPDAGVDGRVIYGAGEPSSYSLVIDATRRCPRCDAPVPSDAEDSSSAWYEDCGNPLCDLPYVGTSTVARLAYEALKGDAESLAVVQDAVEEAGETETADYLRGKQGGWSLRPELAKAYQRSALIRLAKG